jgi:hypothetical protein
MKIYNKFLREEIKYIFYERKVNNFLIEYFKKR